MYAISEYKPQAPHYTVGEWNDGEFTPESDHMTIESATAQVIWLNHGINVEQLQGLSERLKRSLELVQEERDRLQKENQALREALKRASETIESERAK